MKRIAITLAALAISTSAFAGVADNYGDVLADQVASSSSYNAADTWLENHGNVTLDSTSKNRGLPRAIERGRSSEISVGDVDGIFGANPDENF